MSDRRIKFLTRDLQFPQDPTYREYRVIQEVTGVTAQEIMTGTAGIWMLPVLAIVALLRADSNVTRENLEKVMDLDPSQITVTGVLNDEEGKSPKGQKKLTGTKSTVEIPDESGTQVLPTSSQEPQESQTT